jgi:hypothetical protein
VKLGLVLVGEEEGRPWLIGRLTLPFQVCYLLLLQACPEVDWRREEADVPSIG